MYCEKTETKLMRKDFGDNLSVAIYIENSNQPLHCLQVESDLQPQLDMAIYIENNHDTMIISKPLHCLHLVKHLQLGRGDLRYLVEFTNTRMPGGTRQRAQEADARRGPAGWRQGPVDWESMTGTTNRVLGSHYEGIFTNGDLQ